MKIAVLSDIHGNYIALERICEVMHYAEIDYLLILGDFVGYYYHPDKVLNLLEKWEKSFIRGNHERILEKAINSEIIKYETYQKYGSGINFAIEKLNSDQIKLLTECSDKKRLTLDGINFLLCHGSPWDPDYYIYPDSDKSVFDKCLLPGFDFVLIGHSHYSFTYTNNSSVLINPGSVGQSRKQGGIANWAIIDTEWKSYKIVDTQYDVSELIREVKSIDSLNSYLYEILQR